MEEAVPGPLVDGAGDARNRMKLANFSGPPSPSAKVAAVGFVTSLGTVANWQLGVSSRSCGKSSLLMPCSTLYASPAKMRRDLFCAFQPNLVMVPSLPLAFGAPVGRRRLGRP